MLSASGVMLLVGKIPIAHHIFMVVNLSIVKAIAEENLLAIDMSQENAWQQIFPHPPLLSSNRAEWGGINFDCHRQPACEISENYFQQHSIAIYLGDNGAKLSASGHWQSQGAISGDIYLFPACHSMKLEWDREVEFIEIYLEPTVIDGIASELLDGSGVEMIPQFKFRDPLIYQIGLMLRSEVEVGEPGSRIFAESIAAALSVHLVRRYSLRKPKIQEFTGGLPKYKLIAAVEYIHENLDRELSLAEIAGTVQMSSHYFATLFKQSTGLAPHQYITKCRIEKAKILLAKRDLSIVEICLEVGFQSQSHFTKVFRKGTGTTPKVYRDSV